MGHIDQRKGSNVKLSLSVRVAEAACKTRLNVPFSEIVELAGECGYHAVCMRASAAGVEASPDELHSMRETVERSGLTVSMVTADYDVPLNNSNGPNSLRDIEPSLDVAQSLGCDLIRVCLKTDADIEHARRSACTPAATSPPGARPIWRGSAEFDSHINVTPQPCSNRLIVRSRCWNRSTGGISA